MFTNTIRSSLAVCALFATACVEQQDIASDFELSERTTVRGLITLSEELDPLGDGVGNLCIGLYDPDHGCPVGGSTTIRRLVGMFYTSVDINDLQSFPFVFHNVPPGDYLFATRLDADASGCETPSNSGDVSPKSCKELSAISGDIVDVDVKLAFVRP